MRELVARVKERAARRRTTLSRIVQEAVKAYLAQPGTEAAASTPLELITAGQAGGEFPSPRQVAALLAEDEEHYRR